LDRELSEIIKKNPDKELVIQEDQNDDSNANFNVAGSNPPTEQEVKNLFLNMKSLTSAEQQEFLTLRASAKNNPNRDITRKQIQSIYIDFEDDNYKAIFICAFLDPFQTKSLGKQAFQIIDTNKYYKYYFQSVAKLYLSLIELKQSQLELKQSQLELKQNKEILKMLEEITKIFEAYQKVFLPFI